MFRAAAMAILYLLVALHDVDNFVDFLKEAVSAIFDQDGSDDGDHP